MNPKFNQVYFNQREVAALSMALAGMIEDLEKSDNHDWNEEALKYRKEMKLSANSAMDKLVKFCGAKRNLEPYNEGDEREFLNAIPDKN
jgi:hypothetical protein